MENEMKVRSLVVYVAENNESLIWVQVLASAPSVGIKDPRAMEIRSVASRRGLDNRLAVRVWVHGYK